MSQQTFPEYGAGYDSISYQEVSAEEYICLREKNPQCVFDTKIIPPSLGSSGFGKILVNINSYEANFKNNHLIDRTKTESINKNKPSLNTEIKKFENLLMCLIWQILIKKY